MTRIQEIKMNSNERLIKIDTNARDLRMEIEHYHDGFWDTIDWKAVRILILRMYELAFFSDDLLDKETNDG